MKNKPPAGRRPLSARLKQVHGTQHRSRELTHGQADTLHHAGRESQMLLAAQERLHESEERFRALFATSAIGIAVAAPGGKYLQANAAYCRMLGHTEEELRAFAFADFTHPDDLKVNRKLRDELLAGERESFLLEKRYIKRGGDIVWVRTSVSATRGLEGEVTTLVVIAEDITERKLAEDALRHSEEQLRLITNLVPHGIFAKDAAGRHIFANPALAELAGLPIEEILGKDDFELVRDRAQAEAFRADDLAVVRSGDRMVVSEERRTALSGQTRLLKTIKIPFTMASTGETAVLGVCTDITEQKRTDARFRRLVDSNVQGVFFWNTDGQITDANDAFLRMVGYAREDLDARRISWAEMTPPELVEQDQRVLNELAITGVCEPFEKEFVRRDGSRIPVFIAAAMFEDNQDEGFSFVLDLSERKRLEQQFLRAQRMESIGTLAGSVAHDLNNILVPIMLSIDILKGAPQTSETYEVLDTISDCVQRGAGIVRQVLSFARGIEGQRIEVQPKQILHELENILKETFPKNILSRFSVSDDISKILGDPTQIHQILLNLCVNARDAMPSGGTLTVNAENRTLDEHYAAMNIQPKVGSYVYISVTDSGTGIPQNIIHKIFEPFFTTKEMNKGTGLGLSTVMALVESHNGFIDAYSEIGNGTTFKIYLPAIENSSAEWRKPMRHTDIPRGNGETILVVDDETSIINITRRTLAAFGYRVLSAEDGAEAVGIFADQRKEIAVVLTDMNMPILDGANLSRALRRIQPEVKIVATSGRALDLGTSECRETGVNHFLTKPYTAEKLLKTIRAVLDGD